MASANIVTSVYLCNGGTQTEPSTQTEPFPQTEPGPQTEQLQIFWAGIRNFEPTKPNSSFMVKKIPLSRNKRDARLFTFFFLELIGHSLLWPQK